MTIKLMGITSNLFGLGSRELLGGLEPLLQAYIINHFLQLTAHCTPLNVCSLPAGGTEITAAED